MAELHEVSNYKEDNLFKALEMTIFAKVAEDGDDEVTFVHDESGVYVPEGYQSIGITSPDDGATWTRATENSDERGYGIAHILRRDITSDVQGLTVTAKESKRLVMELFWGQEIAAQATANGVYWDKASRPRPRPVRLLGIAKDAGHGDAVYCGRWLTKAMLDEGSDQNWSESESTSYPLSFTAFYDSDYGTSFREMWGGPGFDAVKRGFADAPAGG